jgi:hypothetical protein
MMVKVLVIGYAPDAVDFNDPALPPGLNEAMIAEGLRRDLEKMRLAAVQPSSLAALSRR